MLNRCYQTTWPANGITSKNFKTLLICLLSGGMLYSSSEKIFFPPQQNFILLISFPYKGHQRNNFCVVSKATAKAIDCVTEYITYDILQLCCILYQILCLKFHPSFQSHYNCTDFFWMTRNSVVYLVSTNTTQDSYYVRPAQKTFLIIWMAVWNGMETFPMWTWFVWWGRRFPCETAKDYALLILVETHPPIWLQNYHLLSLTMNDAINCHSLWTCSNSFIPFWPCEWSKKIFGQTFSLKIWVAPVLYITKWS